MAVLVEAVGAPTYEDRRRALKFALDSATFRKNPRLSGLLSYLCERAEDGASEPPKEYSIATDVFGRSTRFDSSTDSIVRVEMHRLRRKLREFYDSEGESATPQILLLAGDYRPQYVVARADSGEPAELALIATAPALPAQASPPTVIMGYRRRYWSVALCALLLAAGLALYFSFRRSDTMRAAVITPAIATADAGDNVRILCGLVTGSAPEELRKIWGPDRFFSGGTAKATPVESLFRTRHPDLYRTARTGEFSYDIPLHRGPHLLTLYFADTSQSERSRVEGGENTRVFNVFANGSLLLQGFDIAADAGLDTADVRIFRDIGPAPDGKLHLSFVHVADASLLNAIEITPAASVPSPAFRMVTQGSEVTTSDGRRWLSDEYFREGRTLLRPIATPLGGDVHSSAADPIYGGERYGNFSYAIPMPAGKYTARLYFSEYFWGPQEPGGGGVGSRVFDVYCNGQTLWKNLDVFSEAGARHALVKTSAHLEPNAQGKLVFAFAPVKNYAMVSAIELLDERSASDSSGH